MIKWLHANRREGCTTESMDSAALNGRLDIVKWLHEHRSEGCTVYAMSSAARHGHLEVVKWLHKNRAEGCTKNAMKVAAANGHLNVVQFLHEYCKVDCPQHAMKMAATSGHLKTFKWLQENQPEPFPVLHAAMWKALGRCLNSYIKCMVLYTTHDRLGWVVDKFVASGDFETVDLLLFEVCGNGVTSIQSKYVDTL